MKSFEAYVEWEINRAKMFQHKLVTDLDGKVRLDFIGRFERLEEDFKKLCGKIGLNVSLPHLNQSQHRDYRSYYTPELRDRVGEFFKRDVELFGYTFDGFKD